MSELTINGSSLGNALVELLSSAEIQPGDTPSYQICKTIYLYHPLGAKMAELPISLAQSQPREISIPKSPEARVKERFLEVWDDLGADAHIHNVMKTARIYGVASIALMAEGVPGDRPINYNELRNLNIAFNVLDPLNTAGSLVLNQDPNAHDFQKNTRGISVSGRPYHPSRAVVVLNEKPIYLGYSTSAFGYVGRSVYQRALFPLKSFVQSMITDDLVTLKAGVLVAKLKPSGSITDQIMQVATGLKRAVLKMARTGNVISVSVDETIESLDLQNLDGAHNSAREHILHNIAAASDGMPAQLLNDETFAEGFGEGTEDAKKVARYIDRVRVDAQPLYAFFDKICWHRAWTPEFYATIQAEFPAEYGRKAYTQAFYEWVNSFEAKWPSLLTEPDSEKIKVEETKLKSIVELVNVLESKLDPENRATLIEWAADNFNENKMMFTSPLQLDFEALKRYVPPVPQIGNGGIDGDDDAGDGDKNLEPQRALPSPSPRADSAVTLPAFPFRRRIAGA